MPNVVRLKVIVLYNLSDFIPNINIVVYQNNFFNYVKYLLEVLVFVFDFSIWCYEPLLFSKTYMVKNFHFSKFQYRFWIFPKNPKKIHKILHGKVFWIEVTNYSTRHCSSSACTSGIATNFYERGQKIFVLRGF